MSLAIDHVVIAVEALRPAITRFRSEGYTVMPGGKHANGATENALICFADGSYLELLALTGEPPAPGMVDFSRMMSAGPGPVGFALRLSGLGTMATAMRSRGIGVGDVIKGERQRPDGVQVAWKLALVDDGFLPFLIEDVTPHELRVPDDPAITTHANGRRGIESVVIGARDLRLTATRYMHLLGAAPDAMMRFRLENADIALEWRKAQFADERLVDIGYYRTLPEEH
ncbi:MAG: VOC family protein [Anaerolineae bacterium]|nr:VOC family protein [Anaerolineae bacterium]